MPKSERSASMVGSSQVRPAASGWMGTGSKWPRFPLRWASCYRYWPVAALSVVDTRTATTLARLMITPFWSASRSYRAWVKPGCAVRPAPERWPQAPRLPAEVLRYHGDVFTAHRVKSDDQHDVVRHSWYLPAR